MRLLLSFARVMGIVVLVLAAFWATVALARHEFMASGFVFALAAGGLCLSIFSEKAIARKKQQAEKDVTLEALRFSDSALDVPFRWFRWLCFVVALLLIFGVTGLLARATWQEGKLIPVALLGSFAVLLFVYIGSLFVSGYAAWQSGSALKADLLGLKLSGLPAIAWKHIRGIDLKQFEVKGQKKAILMLALDPATFNGLKSALIPRSLHWAGPKLREKSAVVEVGCDFLGRDPEFVVRAVQFIADKSGGRRVKGWNYLEAIDVAEQREQAAELRREANRKSDLLFAELQRMNRAGPVDEKRLAEIDRQMQAELERMSSAADAEVNAFKHNMSALDERLKPLKWFYRGMVVLLIVMIGGAVLRIVLTLKS